MTDRRIKREDPPTIKDMREAFPDENHAMLNRAVNMAIAKTDSADIHPHITTFMWALENLELIKQQLEIIHQESNETRTYH